MKRGDSILVVGGRGYIGRRLIDWWKARYRVVSLDIGWNPPISQAGVEDWTGDMRDVGSEDLSGFVGVVCLASTAMPDHDRRLRFYDAYVANLEGALNLVRCCKESGVRRMVFASTTSVLGYVARREPVDESSIPEPDERYGEVKLMIESILRREACGYFNPVILRQGTVFGWSPKMRFDLVVNAMCKTAYQEGKVFVYGSGDRVRPLVYIGDVCQAYEIALHRAPRLSGEVFHLAYGNYTIAEIASIVSKVSGSPVVQVGESSDRRSYCADTSKASNLLYTPVVSVEDGAREVLQNLREGRIKDPESVTLYNSKLLVDLLGKEVQDA